MSQIWRIVPTLLLPVGRFFRSGRLAFASLLLVWLLAAVLSPANLSLLPQSQVAQSKVVQLQVSLSGSALRGHAGLLTQVASEQDRLLQAQPQRSSPQLFLHPKQRAVYQWLADVVTPLLPLLWSVLAWLPALLPLLWYLRAGRRRSFRLSFWRDANLCQKRQLYH